MKKTILLSSIFAVSAAFAKPAVVTSGNMIGALDTAIATSESQKQVLISVPFLGYETGGAVKVCDMVKTSNLDKDSKLYVPDGNGAYNTWTLNSDGEWVADEKVTIGAGGQPSEGQSASQADATVNRGDAFWLEPIFKNKATSGTIFLLGQGADGAGSSDAAAGKWNLIGNASIAPKTIDITGTDGDQIVAQVGGVLRYYTYTAANGWSYKAKGKLTKGNPVIAAGQGLWYKPANKTTINW